MQKIVVRRPGGFSRLELQTLPDPLPGAGEVRVAVRAAGVNYADCVVRMGLYKSAREFVGWPITPGFEFAGIVDAVGEGVSDLPVGSRVFGVTRFGGYASRIVAGRDWVAPIPAQLSFEQAGSFPVAFLTARYGLMELGAARAGSNVLIHSAAGGVGTALCQLARAAGVRCFAVVGSPHKLEHARAHGASEVVDKSRSDWRSAARAFAPNGFDVVLDANGADTLKHSYQLLAPMGRLIIYGFHTMMAHGGLPNLPRLVVQYLRTPRFDPLSMIDRNVGVFAFNLSYLFTQAHLYLDAMREFSAQLERGALTPLPVQTFPLADAAGAHRALQTGKILGKLALVPEV